MDSGRNGISAAQRFRLGVDHKNLRIIGNRIFRSGKFMTDKAAHGIYVQSQDVLIEDNLVDGVGDGNGISIRSSGIVKNNVVRNVMRPSSRGAHGIAYYSDHVSGDSGTLRIVNNVVYADTLSGVGHAIGLLRPARDNPRGQAGEVRRFVIRDNILVARRRMGIGIYASRHWRDVEMSGNRDVIRRPGG